MTIIPLEQQANYLVPSIFAIAFYIMAWGDRGATKGVSKRYVRKCVWHMIFWIGIFVLEIATVVFS
jgi:hypothetical protein